MTPFGSLAAIVPIVSEEDLIAEVVVVDEDEGGGENMSVRCLFISNAVGR